MTTTPNGGPLDPMPVDQMPTDQRPVTRRKIYPSADAALADVADGASIAIGGYAGCGVPQGLIQAMLDHGARDLTCICQGAWPQPGSPAEMSGLGATHQGATHVDAAQLPEVTQLIEAGLVTRLIAPLPFPPDRGAAVRELWESGALAVEVVPFGILAERLRAGGAGLGGVFLPTGVNTRFAEGLEVRRIDGRDHLFHRALKADFALVRARAADTLGNLVYRGTQRNWNPPMATAAAVTVAEVDDVVEPGGLDPELVITPAIYVNRIVLSSQP